MANSQNYCIKNIVAQTNCSIPDPIISYILHKDNKIFLHKPDEYVYKICSVCKYFFSKLRLIPCSQLSVEYDCLKFWYTPTIIPKPTAKISFQDLKKAKNFFSPVVLCMDTTKLDLSQSKVSPSKIISNIITKMYSYNILKIILRNQELTLPELIFLTPNNKDLIFFNCKVVQNDGLTVSVEEILTVSPKIRQLALYCDEDSELNYCVPLTSQKLAALPPSKCLKILNIHNVTDDFKASHFVEFIKKNHKNCELVIFNVKFHRNVCPIFIQNFKSNVDTGINIILQDSIGQKIYFHAW